MAPGGGLFTIRILAESARSAIRGSLRKTPKLPSILAKRTLTNLYNERPTWLDLAHRRLDEAVFAAYGWDPSFTDDQLLEKLLALNLKRAAGEGR